MEDNEIKNMIQQHEGYRPYVYYDSLGYPTGGYGHAFLPNSPISHNVAALLFEEDYKRAVEDYEKFGWCLDSVRRAVIIDMLFNLGMTRFRSFENMISAIIKGDYETAANEMLNSRWSKQVKGRANRLESMMRTGKE